MVALVPVEPWHLLWVGAHAREADRAECWAADRSSVTASLQRALPNSAKAWTGLVHGVPACVFGVAPASLLTGVGVPWMLGTDRLEQAERPLVRLSRPTLDVMHALFPRLVNFVDNRNERAMRWLAWLGFTLSDPVPMGPDGLPFRRFERVCHV